MTTYVVRCFAALLPAAVLSVPAGCSKETDFFPDDGGAGVHAGASGSSTAGSGSGASPSTGGSAGTGSFGGGAGSPLGGSAGSGAGNGGSPQGGAGASGGSSSGSENGGGAGEAGDGENGGAGEASGGEAGVGAGGTGGVAGQSGNGGIGGIGGTGGTAGAGAKGGTTGEGGEAGSSCSPAVERCNGLDDDCNDAVDEGSVCPSGCSAKTREGHTYLLCLASGSTSGPVYGGARARCEAAAETLELGVDFELVRIESEPENDFLKAWIAASTSTSGAIWIGANDLEDENIWVWGDDPPSERFFTASNQGGGSPYMGRFNDFAEGRPNGVNGGTEDCGAMDSSFSWHWNDVVCSNGRLGYLCEQTP